MREVDGQNEHRPPGTGRRVLVLSTTTGYQLRAFGEAAQSMGVALVFGTDRCQTLDDPWRDQAIAVRFHEEEASLDAIVRASREQPVDGILAVGDRPVSLAARAAVALGLPGNPPEAARASAQKRLARELFQRAGLPVPAFVPGSTGQGARPFIGRVEFPVVLKPVGLSGSRGVIRADSEAELAAAIARVSALLSRPEIRERRTGDEQDLLVESFIEGREYAIEGLLTHGVFTALAVFDKPDPLDGPFFEETIYVTPSRAPRSTVEAIVETVRRACAALGLWHGPVHAECRVNGSGVFILEVAARPIGGLCSRVLRFREGGQSPFSEQPPVRAPFDSVRSAEGQPLQGRLLSLEEVLLRHAVGEPVSGIVREERAAAVMMVPIPSEGTFKGVSGVDEARGVPSVEEVLITAKPDQRLERLPEAGSYLGFIFARAGEAAEAEAAVRAAHARLRFRIQAPIPVRPVRSG